MIWSERDTESKREREGPYKGRQRDRETERETERDGERRGNKERDRGRETEKRRKQRIECDGNGLVERRVGVGGWMVVAYVCVHVCVCLGGRGGGFRW